MGTPEIEPVIDQVDTTETNPAKLSPTDRQAIADAALLDSKSTLATGLVNAGYKTWDVTEKQSFIDKGFRKFRPSEKPSVSVFIRPDDYANDLDRGTVSLHPELKNYSFLAVIIPDNAVVSKHNFAQRYPNTPAIQGNNITFIECNLSNVAIDPSWQLINCMTAQSWIILDVDGNETRQFICSHPIQLTGQEKEPVGIIKTRDF